MSIVIVSGGFDPIHVGHLNLFEAASRYGHVIVCLNSDGWLAKVKGTPFMTFEERKYLIGALIWVNKVIKFDDSDGTACNGIQRMYNFYHGDYPDEVLYFANGGSKKGENKAEIALCEKLGIELLWNVGGEKCQSSIDRLKSWCKYHIKEHMNKFFGE